VLRKNLNFATNVLLAGGDFRQPVFEYKQNERDIGEAKDYWFFKYSENKIRVSNNQYQNNYNNNFGTKRLVPDHLRPKFSGFGGGFNSGFGQTSFGGGLNSGYVTNNQLSDEEVIAANNAANEKFKE
jgi:hypothetical protein